ncbi:nickel pincer cofactor biosynthesis protein LarB [Candidatus Thorarchaeota archaeon]|nr:MAG: nickel pincer cofactor biosynthesis protein LarB [Candidatus Thorarchaeota archaeon]
MRGLTARKRGRRMTRNIRNLLEDLVEERISLEDAEQLLRNLSLKRVSDFAAIDTERESRSGIPEVVLADTKDTEQFMEIMRNIATTHGVAMGTRVDDEKRNRLEKEFSDYNLEVLGKPGHYTALVYSEDWSPPDINGKIAVVTAGTSDIPFSIEVEMIARVMGIEVLKFYDVGVAGIHRLVEPMEEIIKNDTDAVVVVAGMEGALPTVVASLLDIPVIGLPVPIGYGYGGNGETALASMLQSCAPGLAVVNIGNGLGAGSIACLIAKRCAKIRDKQG